MSQPEDKESLARAHLPFRAEYCKTSRAKCKKCSENMEAGSVKLAIMTKSRWHDGYDASFYHVSCFFRVKRPQSVAEIGHFETLKYEDQKVIEKAVESKGQSVLGVQVEQAIQENKKASKSKSKSVKREAPVSDQLCTYEDFQVEYAKSNRSKCKICDEKIEKETVRLGKMDYEAETPHGGPVPRWYHVDCFVKHQEDIEFFGMIEKIAGFSHLNKGDKKMLKSKIKPILPKITGDSLKKRKEVEHDNEEEKLLKAQSDRIFKLREFVNSMQRKDIESMLNHMKQKSNYKSPSVLIDMATDVLLFGPIRKCPECKQRGHIQLRGSSYICTYGWDSTPCNYETRQPTRKEPDLPEDLIEKYEYFQTHYKFRGGQRIFSNKLLKAVEVKEAENNKIALKDAPLEGLHIGILSWNGLKNDKTRIQNKVVTSGGKLISSLDSSLFVAIASKLEVDKESPKVEVAKALNIPFVSDEFLFAIETKQDVVPQITKHLVIPWIGDLTRRFVDMTTKRD